ncbi:MAG TPA: hypothetical protein VFA40_23940 [Terriglobales bacterium]|nr:hypothetical protein [Terriglobales bacterium]
MKHCPRIAAIVLVIAGMTSALVAQLSPTSNPHAKSAGCHEHGKKSPSRQPADYKCCVAGHEAALLRSTATSHPVSQIGNVIPLGVPLVIELISLSPSIAVTPPNPGSRNAPLRV